MFLSFKYVLVLPLISLVILTPKQSNAAENDKINATTIAPETTTKEVKKFKVMETDLCKKCFCYQPSLTLDCSNRNISEWFKDDELNALENDNEYQFETINLEGNQLTSISEFPSLINLKTLNFHNNKIKNITNGAFTKLISLKKLDLSYNLLITQELRSDVFKGKYNPDLYEPMTNLTELNLSGNNLHSLQSTAFEHFPKLEVLNLSSNLFQHIDDLSKIAISGLGYIKEIDLSYMELSDLPEFLFNYHGNDIKILRLNGNKFTNLPTKSIAKARSLEILYLDENPFEEFNEENKLPILLNLKELYINNCPNLTSIGAKSFIALHNLTKLVVTNNPKLKTIHVNSLAYFPENSLEAFYPPLKLIDLKNNKIEVLPSKILGNWTNIEKIDLRNNPWTCTCKNNFLLNTLIAEIRRMDSSLLENVICEKPDQFKGIELKYYNTKDGITINCNYQETSSSLSDYTVITGMLIGVLMSIPLTFIFIIVYKRGCFGFMNANNPAGFSRAFYSKTSNDDFM